jgi:hypothetical protein
MQLSSDVRHDLIKAAYRQSGTLTLAESIDIINSDLAISLELCLASPKDEEILKELIFWKESSLRK